MRGGKRSAVAGVNDSPVDCQSRGGVARRRLAEKLTEGVAVRATEKNTPPASPMCTHSLVVLSKRSASKDDMGEMVRIRPT